MVMNFLQVYQPAVENQGADRAADFLIDLFVGPEYHERYKRMRM